MANIPKARKKTSAIRIILWGIGILLIIGYISSTVDAPNHSVFVSDSARSNVETAAPQREEKKNLWHYSTEVDKMDNTETIQASLTAANTLTFGFPYGESSFTLNVRKWKGETAVYLSCSECQFLTGISDEKRYRLKIDDDPPFVVTANQPSDGSSTTVFLGNTEKIISKLRTANELIIEAEFFQEGYQQIVFPVKGLQWK